MIMSTSRDLNTLIPELYDRASLLQEKCEFEGVPILIYCTYRSLEAQSRLYRQGRSTEKIEQKRDELVREWNRPDLAEILMGVGPQYGQYVKTKAGPGQSYHNYGRAIDGVPLRDGECVWGDKEEQDAALWSLYGRMCTEIGLKWGGHWQWPDKPHAQLPGLNWRKLIVRGSYDPRYRVIV